MENMEEVVNSNILTPEEMYEKPWYVVTTYSGYENKVKEYLERRIESMGLEDLITRVIVPEVEEVNADGKKKMKKIFPGYVLIQMDITDEAWYIVRNTPNVTGFVGSSGGGAKPIPLQDAEIEDIFDQMKNATLALDYQVGDTVEIRTMPLTEDGDKEARYVEGKVLSIDEENAMVNVAFNYLGAQEKEFSIEDIRKIQV